MEGRKQFTFYRSFYEAAITLPKSNQLKLLLAILRYGLDREMPADLNERQMGIFVMAKPNLDASWRKAQAGSIGGKISRRGPAKKAKLSKGENENEIEIEIENESESKGEGFPRFWARYPVQIGEAAAREAWACVVLSHDEAFILNSLERWRKSKDWAREDGRFIPKPEKWLAEGWFLKEPQQVIPMGASGELGQAELEAIQRLLKED